MIRVEVTGDEALARVFARLPASVRGALTARVLALTLVLQAHIQRNKLSGQVLNVVTGALRRSIFQDVSENEQGIWGRVFSSGDVKYARIHELGGQTKAHIIMPRKAKALAFMFGGKMSFFAKVNHPGSKMPERSFMRTGLADQAARIQSELKLGVIQGIQAAGGAVS